MLWKRLALIPVGILVGVLVLEGSLQLTAALVKRIEGSRLPATWVTGNLRVLCLGDSNTYGLWLERREAYPQQLEALWNAQVESPKLEVLNLGFPGTNSSRLVRDLPQILDTFAPDIAIIMVGVNDFWTLPFPIEEARRQRPRKGFLQRHSLIYKLYYLASRGRDARQLEILQDPAGTLRGAQHRARYGDVEFEMGFVKADPGLQGDEQGLRENLRALAARARDAGTRLYFMSYPSRFKFYALANPVIHEVAEATETPLIDLTRVFESICPQEECPEILFPDHHPRAPGYRIVAETIIDALGKGE